MVTYWIHTVSIIDEIHSSVKCVWSIFRQYGHNTFEILSYYIDNNKYISFLELYMLSSRICANSEFIKQYIVDSTRKTGRTGYKVDNLLEANTEQTIIAKNQTYTSFGCF